MRDIIGVENLLSSESVDALSERVTTLLERIETMSTVSPLAQSGNPQTYTIYALTGPIPIASTTWKDVRYVGMSINPQSRLLQHLSCSDTSNESKNDWIRSVLATGQIPVLHEVEKVVGQEKAREREQYWIRYAMAQGADILNRAITYIGDEREQAAHKRAIQRAWAAKIALSGTFLKRAYAYYPDEMRKAMDASGNLFNIWEIDRIFFIGQDGQECNIERASDKEFDAFIKRFIPVMDFDDYHWYFEDRVSAVRFAHYLGKTPDLYRVELPVKGKRKKKK